MTKTKVPNNQITETKNTSLLKDILLNVRVLVDDKNGNLPDIDGYLEILDKDEETSTGLKLEYQLKALTKNKQPSVQVPKSMLHRVLTALNPLIVCAVSKEDNCLHFGYLTKNFCREEIEKKNNATVTLYLKSKINGGTLTDEAINEHRKILIKICEFHKNKGNDTAIKSLIKQIEDPFYLESGVNFIAKLNLIDSVLHYRNDDGEYEIQDYFFSKVHPLFECAVSSDNVVSSLKKLIDIAEGCKFYDPKKVIDFFFLGYSLCSDEQSKNLFRKKILNLAQYDYQTLKLIGYNYQIQILEFIKNNLSTLDIELQCSVYKNVLELDFDGTTDGDAPNQINIHRGVLTYNNNLNKLRDTAISSLCSLYGSTDDFKNRKLIIETLNTCFHKQTNSTDPVNQVEIDKKVALQEKKIIKFYTSLVSDVNTSFIEILEIEKSVCYLGSNAKNLLKVIDELPLEYKIFSNIFLDVWRYKKDEHFDYDKLPKQNIEQTEGYLKSGTKVYLVDVIEESSLFLNQGLVQLFFPQLINNLKAIGRSLTSDQIKYLVTKNINIQILAIVVTGFLEINPKGLNLKSGSNKFLLTLLSAVFYLSEKTMIDTTFINKINSTKLESLERLLFIYSFQGLMSLGFDKVFKNHKPLFFSYLEIANKKSIRIVEIINFADRDNNLNSITKRDIERIFNLIIVQEPDISGLFYGGILEKIFTKYPKVGLSLLEKRLEFKSTEKYNYRYDEIPDHINFLKFFKKKEVEDFLSKISKMDINTFTKNKIKLTLNYCINQTA